jgi:hypothetical protein
LDTYAGSGLLQGNTTSLRITAERLLHESFLELKALYTDGGFSATALGAEQILERTAIAEASSGTARRI